MQAFLKQVASHYFSGEMPSRCFVFPNHRSLMFFRKYFAEEVVARSSKPVLSPLLLTIDELFYRLAGSVQTDRVRLLLELYACYKLLQPKAEELDEFIFWGDVLLSDFDDVDKYRVDAARLFANVSDFKNLQDQWDYLTEAQREAISRFLGHFRDQRKIKQEFLVVWEILLPLYRSFRDRLQAAGLSYAGMVYRTVADRLDSESAADLLAPHFAGVEQFVFVGLNALNACERQLLRKMRNAGIAEFCWDYASPMIQHPDNKSSFFLSANVREFPQAFQTDPAGFPETEFHLVSVPSGVGMAKQLPAILGAEAGIDTAIVLADEELLLPVLNSIPASIRDLNVTMGYPMRASSLWSLMNDIATLQLHLRCKNGEWTFYHKQLRALASNAVFRCALTEEERTILAGVEQTPAYYIACRALSGGPLLDAVFRPVVTEPAGKSAEGIRAICQYQLQILTVLASRLKADSGMAVELDFARAFYEAVSKLERYRLGILPLTYFRMLTQMVGGAAVPFTGEPLQGLQVMGPLETRALDFDKIIIVGCNEGTFPRRQISASFIPPELRRGFDLPTYEYQDAVWAYYFYRMIQRASTVWMLCDARTEGVNTGEPSRYIRQLELHFGVHIRRYSPAVTFFARPAPEDPVKTADQVRALREGRLSASAINQYITCPAKFYYGKVCGLKEDQGVVEYLDAGMQGSVFHAVVQDLYGRQVHIDAPFLRHWLQEPDTIREMVREQVLSALSTDELTGRNILYADMIFQYVMQVLRRDLDLLKKEGVPYFTMLGTELMRKGTIEGFPFIGFIDRLDMLTPDKVRVVDYKTGRVEKEDLEPEPGKFPTIGLQLYLYKRLLVGDPRCAGKEIVFSIYQPTRLFVEEIREIVQPAPVEAALEQALSKALSDIADLSLRWVRTEQAEPCQYCDFKLICGR